MIYARYSRCMELGLRSRSGLEANKICGLERGLEIRQHVRSGQLKLRLMRIDVREQSKFAPTDLYLVNKAYPGTGLHDEGVSHNPAVDSLPMSSRKKGTAKTMRASKPSTMAMADFHTGVSFPPSPINS